MILVLGWSCWLSDHHALLVDHIEPVDPPVSIFKVFHFSDKIFVVCRCSFIVQKFVTHIVVGNLLLKWKVIYLKCYKGFNWTLSIHSMSIPIFCLTGHPWIMKPNFEFFLNPCLTRKCTHFLGCWKYCMWKHLERYLLTSICVLPHLSLCGKHEKAYLEQHLAWQDVAVE